MIASDPCLLTIGAASRAIQAGELTPAEITEAMLDRLTKVQPVYHPYATVMAEHALAEAKRAEREINDGHYRGPLHGIPIGVKDVIDVAGVPTRCGSAASLNVPAREDAAAIARLRAAGAVVLGKTVTHEYAFGSTSPPTRNAWNVHAIPGGSSGGSGVAVALDVAYAGLGTDTGSSVRNPASLNGVVGLKPTFGRVSRRGVVPCSWTCDHVGVIAKTVEDAALVFALMADPDPRSSETSREVVSDWTTGQETAASLEGVRLGVPQNFFFEGIDPDVGAAVDEAIRTLEELGATLIPVTVPLVEYAYSVAMVVVIVEGAALHRRQLRERGPLYSEPVRDFLHAGQLMFGTGYLDAQRVRSLITDGVRRAFDDNRLDALVTPTSPLGAMPIGQELVSIGDEAPTPVMSHYARLTCPFNLCGAPAISVPCGFDGDRHPIGLQIAGRPFDEDTVLRIGFAYQEATTWHLQRAQHSEETIP